MTAGFIQFWNAFEIIEAEKYTNKKESRKIYTQERIKKIIQTRKNQRNLSPKI
jgi:hypothetical protein